MQQWQHFVAVTLAVLACGVARAGDAPSAAPDPARLALAEQIVAASGGADQATRLMRSMFGVMQKNIVANSPADMRDFVGPMVEDMSQALVGMTPQILELNARAYAQTFSEKELRDLLAFQTSETGRDVANKLPALQAQVMNELFPLLMTAMPAIMRKSVDRICEEKHCTSEQRAALEKAMSKATGATTS
jgi:hypothetical protein